MTKRGSASKALVGVGNALPATTIVVTNTNDSGPGSLRAALASANDGDTIDATDGVVVSNHGTLIVTNSTISGNSARAGQGGAIFNVGEATIGDTVLNAGASGGTNNERRED